MLTFSAHQSSLQTEYIINGKRLPSANNGTRKGKKLQRYYAHLKLPVSQMINIFNIHMIMSSIATTFVYNN